MKQEIRDKFLTNTDETGRFIVHSRRTGKTYFIEPILGNRVQWGDVDPATKKITGSYGSKYSGGIKESESLITEENGFENIRVLDPGVSPLKAIEFFDDQYPDK